MKFKRYLVATLLLGTIAGPVTAGPDAMTAKDARHLIARTGFGAAPAEVNAMIGLSYAEGVARIIGGLRTTPKRPMPAWTDQWDYPADLIWTLGQTQTDLFYTARWEEMHELSAWWIAEMVATPSPLTERLVLFWSDHFANGFEAHEKSQWLARQNRFLRTHAAGNFAALAQGMLHDPAVLEYLDNGSNIAAAPNENLGREFLELFTLGEGRGYDQNDVRAASAMLTGLTIADEGRPETTFNRDDHDGGPKTIFGQTGRFGPADLTPLTLHNPAFGPYIVEKLWRALISDQPDPAEVTRLTKLWKHNNLELRPLLTALLLTDAFWAEENRGRLVKSPMELLVGTTRTLGLERADARDLIWMAEDLDQILFQPPNVGGWPEGTAWINDATALARATTLTHLLSFEDDDHQNPGGLMMSAPTKPKPVAVGPSDLRVGQVFATYVEIRDPGHGFGGHFTLFDLGFYGQDWRSLPVWLEHHPEDVYTSLSIYIGDCAPSCLSSLPPLDDDPHWVEIETDALLSEETLHVSKEDAAFLRALGGHLPDLIAQTGNQIPFRAIPSEPEHVPADLARFVVAAIHLSDAVQSSIGGTTGRLVAAQSAPGVIGVPGDGAIADVAAMEAYMDATDAARRQPLRPAHAHSSAQDWLNALPGTGPQSVRAADMLLAVPRPAEGQRDALVATDAEALLRQLILSPAYQVK